MFDNTNDPKKSGNGLTKSKKKKVLEEFLNVIKVIKVLNNLYVKQSKLLLN